MIKILQAYEVIDIPHVYLLMTTIATRLFNHTTIR